MATSLNLQKENLEDEKSKKTQEVKSVQFMSFLENQKNQKYSLQANMISKEIQKLEKDRQNYIAQAKKLEVNARKLESLIAKLTSKKKPNQSYSYKFVSGLMSWPVRGSILRYYGLQNHEKYNIQTINNGIDISAAPGTSVKAAAEGEVVYSDSFTGSGYMIIIDHKNGFHSVYSNNSQLLVSRGSHVSKGQSIALSGSNPANGQNALHFEVRKNGKPVNPLSYLK